MLHDYQTAKNCSIKPQQKTARGRVAKLGVMKDEKVKLITIVFLILLGGCASNATKPSHQEKEVEVRTIHKEYTPQVWSDHKVLKISAERCAEKGKKILESIGFSQIIKNDNYVYGNYSSNRAVVKCASIDEGTFVYVVVAGAEVKLVEKLRNEIVWQL